MEICCNDANPTKKNERHFFFFNIIIISTQNTPAYIFVWWIFFWVSPLPNGVQNYMEKYILRRLYGKLTRFLLLIDREHSFCFSETYSKQNILMRNLIKKCFQKTVYRNYPIESIFIFHVYLICLCLFSLKF